ncbi:MAG: glutathione S-transferase [Alphaproteobacteria bacterium]|jgi:glutathione S-transferase|nr:glutathione S-transferase [Alphaproteobacteria bacterium]
MITIYNFWRGIRGVRVAWQCDEMGLDYQAVGFDFPVPAEYRAKYPPGSVPFLEDEGGVAIGESVAQMLYLAGRYGPTPLLPTDPAAMARVLQITVASEASLGGLMNQMMGTKFAAPGNQKSNWTDGFCAARVTDGLAYADGLLRGRDYFVGDGLTLADIAVSTALGMWQGALGKDIPTGLAEHRTRMQARPAYQKGAGAFRAP